MGPKKKEKKNKKKKEEKPPKPTKSQYVAKIADRNAALAKVRTETLAVENDYFNTDKRYEQIQEDMADILAYIQHEIEENEMEIAEYDESIGGLKTEMKEQDTYYQGIFQKMEAEFEEKQEYFQNQIQIANTKLFASAEIKKQREEFLKKKEAVLQKMRDMEARHKKEIYEAEKEAIIKQDKMQKQMATQLTSLANDFRQATDTAIGETTNKLIRESIDLGNMLTCMEQIIEKARNAYLKTHGIETKIRFNAELLDDEHSVILQKFAFQSDYIDELIRSVEDINKRISNSQKLFKENRRLRRQIAEKECILKEKIFELNDHSKTLQESEDIHNSVKIIFDTWKKNVFRIQSFLFEAAKSVKQGIDIEHLTRFGQEEDFYDMDKEELEENLREHKFKVREFRIEEAAEKLLGGLMSDTEMQLMAPSSESYMSSHNESMTSGVAIRRSKDLYSKSEIPKQRESK